MGIVAGEEHPVGAEALDDIGKHGFLRLDADITLLQEIFARSALEPRYPLRMHLVVLVQAVQPERQPAAARFEECHPQTGVPCHHAAGDHLREGEHGLHAVRHAVGEEEVVKLLDTGRWDRRRTGALVGVDGNAEAHCLAPQRIVIGIVKTATAHGIRPNEGTAEAELRDRAVELAAGVAHVLQRNHGDADEAARVGFAEIVQPIVVGSCAGQCEIHVLGAHRHMQSHRRIEQRYVYAHVVHVLEAHLGALIAHLRIVRKVVVNPSLPAVVAKPLGPSHTGSAFDGKQPAVHHQACAVTVGDQAWRHVPVAGLDVIDPQIGVFHEMSIAVDDGADSVIACRAHRLRRACHQRQWCDA